MYSNNTHTHIPPSIGMDSDLDGFDDIRVRTIVYYITKWYTDSRSNLVDKFRLYNIYCWLVDKKTTTLKMIFQDIHRYDTLMHYLNNYGAENEDFQGAVYYLQDIRLTLISFEIDLLTNNSRNIFTNNK